MFRAQRSNPRFNATSGSPIQENCIIAMLVCANENTLKIVRIHMKTCNHQSSLRLNEYSILKSHDLSIPLQRGGYISSTPVSLMPRSFFAKKKCWTPPI